MRSTMLEEAKIERLLAGLRAAFHGQEFDTTRVMFVAEYDSPQLMSMLEDTIPGCRRPRLLGGTHLRDAPIRRVLTALAKQYFTTDRYGWWRLKQNPSEGDYYDVES